MQQIIHETQLDALAAAPADAPPAQPAPQLLVLNKVDALSPEARAALPPPATWANVHELVGAPAAVLAISAREGGGVSNLLAEIEKALLGRAERVEALLPYAASGALLAEMKQTGSVVEESYEADGVRVVAFVPRKLRARMAKEGLL